MRCTHDLWACVPENHSAYLLCDALTIYVHAYLKMIVCTCYAMHLRFMSMRTWKLKCAFVPKCAEIIHLIHTMMSQNGHMDRGSSSQNLHCWIMHRGRLDRSTLSTTGVWVATKPMVLPLVIVRLNKANENCTVCGSFYLKFNIHLFSRWHISFKVISLQMTCCIAVYCMNTVYGVLIAKIFTLIHVYLH